MAAPPRPSSSTFPTRCRTPSPTTAAPWCPINYANDLQLIKSANTANGASDGDFGNLGEGGLGSTGSGFTRALELHRQPVQLQRRPRKPGRWSPRRASRARGWSCSSTRAARLPADDYRVYIPNQVDTSRVNTRSTADLRHLRQSARRRKPGQPDVAVQPRLQQSGRPGRRSPITKTCSAAASIARTT